MTFGKRSVRRIVAVVPFDAVLRAAETEFADSKYSVNREPASDPDVHAVPVYVVDSDSNSFSHVSATGNR